MSATIAKDVLLDALSRVVLTCGYARSFPIMGCVLSSGGTLTTTNMESFTSVTLPTSLPTFAVDARRLHGIVRALDGDDVTLTVTGSDLSVQCGRAAYKLHGWNADDFPTTPTCSVYGAVDAAGLDAVLGMAARLDTDRFGVQFGWEDGAVSVAATDGYRLVRCGDAPGTAVVWGKGLRALVGLTPNAIGVTDDWAFFRNDTVTVGVRRQSGTYPDVAAAVRDARSNASGTAHVDGARLRDALGRVALLSGDTARVAISFAGGRLTLTAASDGAGEATDAVPYEGTAKLETAVNAKYLADFARFAGEHVEITVNGSVGSPLLFTTDGLPGTDYVLMPMR